MREVLIAPIRLYQRTVSPMLGRRCKYHPTCSEYAVGAIREFGAFRHARRLTSAEGYFRALADTLRACTKCATDRLETKQWTNSRF